jgi:hypothetical protein
MAGRRRAVNGRTDTKPRQVESRQQRQRRRLAEQLGVAQNPAQRVGAASDYARAALATLARSDAQTAEVLASQLVRALRAAGDRAFKYGSDRKGTRR